MRLAPPLTLALALFAAACTDAPVQPVVDDPSLMRAPVQVAPFGPFVATACSGEKVELTGETRMQVGIADDRPGRQAEFRVETEGYGVGPESGARYRFRDSYRFHAQSSGNGATTTTDIGKTQLIALGPYPDLQVNIRFHFTTNANGVTTAEVVSVEQTCK